LTNPCITQALTRLFDKHRIVFWRDAQREVRAEFNSLDLLEVQLAHREFHTDQTAIWVSDLEPGLSFVRPPKGIATHPHKGASWMLVISPNHSSWPIAARQHRTSSSSPSQCGGPQSQHPLPNRRVK